MSTQKILPGAISTTIFFLFSLIFFLGVQDQALSSCPDNYPSSTCNLSPQDYCGGCTRLDTYVCVEQGDNCVLSPTGANYYVNCGNSCTFDVYDPHPNGCEWDYTGPDPFCHAVSWEDRSQGTCCVNYTGGGGGGGGGTEPPPVCPEACGCIDKDTPEGMGCWCEVGGWQYHNPEGCIPPESDYPSCPAGCGNTGGGGGGGCNDSCSCSNYACVPGTSLTATGPLCTAGTESCTCTTECGNIHTNTGTSMCYYPETNILTPESPTQVTMTVAGYSIPLTSNPTLIPMPLASNGETASVSIPDYPGDSTGARAVKYYMCFNNIGEYDWDDPVDVNPWRPPNQLEDFCSSSPCDNSPSGMQSTSIIQPSGYSIYEVLTQGAQGGNWSEYRFVDKCDNTCTYSHNSSDGWITGRYLVNTYPEFVDFDDLTDRNEAFLGCTTNWSSTRLNDELEYSVTVSDVNGASNIETISVWFSADGNPPTIKDLAVGGTPGSSPESKEFGFLVERSRNQNVWNHIFIPRYQPDQANPLIWWRPNDGTQNIDATNNGYNVRILDPDGNPIAIIRNVSISENGNDATLNFKLILLHELNHDITGAYTIDDYRSIPNDEYSIAFAVGDEFGFSASNILQHRVVPDWNVIPDDQYSLKVDFTPPVFTMSDLVVAGSQEINFTWNAKEPILSNQSGFKKVVLDSYFSPPPPPSVIGNITLGHEREYNFVPNLIDLLNHGDTHLYADSNYHESIVEKIDLLDLNEGSLGFYGGALDNACNFSRCNGENSYSSDNQGYTPEDGSCLSQDIGETWVVTRGGNVYSSGGYDLNMYPILPYTGSQSKLTPQADLFEDPFRIQVFYPRDDASVSLDDIKISSGLLMAGNSTLNGVEDYLYSGFIKRDYPASQDRNADPQYKDLVELYREVKSRSDALGEEKFFEMTYQNNVQISNNSSTPLSFGTISPSQCPDNYKYCVFRPVDFYSTSNVEFQPGFTCNRPTIIFVPGNLTVNPDLVRRGSISNGCLFIVRSSISIESGNLRQSPMLMPPEICRTDLTDTDCYPIYDLLEGFFLTDGKITIQEDNTNPTIPGSSNVNDALHVRGALIAKGETGVNRATSAIENYRTLRLVLNNRFPTLVIHGDPRYYEMVKDAFGMYQYSYSTDIGFK
ncbi:hypothetical protein KC685_03825 [Candidatus Dojkabacteria bacterium]|uniref:Uncharacterized protein n=1 Tax=Candidatus Dojkabacteria bacterium TaxID=2099670 RepID=A0A955I3A1_9BACT|nr:hypothetical protein [Candidatus Dojkabacteria bacterium]